MTNHDTFAQADAARRNAHPGHFVIQSLRLRKAVERLHLIAIASERARGTSWEQIGDVLGITKSGAHKRYHGPVTDELARIAQEWPGVDPFIAAQDELAAAHATVKMIVELQDQMSGLYLAMDQASGRT
jgi:hypothetical protein